MSALKMTVLGNFFPVYALSIKKKLATTYCVCINDSLATFWSDT